MYHSSLLTVSIALISVLSSQGNTDAADPPAPQRWAILTTPEIQSSGLADLLMVELTKRSIEQVERVALEEIHREQELAAAYEAQAAARRIKLGRIAKADVLLILMTVEQDETRFIRCVICESRFGARLSTTAVVSQLTEPDADWLERAALEIANIAAHTQARFPEGVQQIVSVSPFLSKNLTHDYDHLQFGLAGLLGEVLSAQAGVAVLEIEEAREISKEVELTADAIADRIVPVTVDGEFIVSGKAGVATESTAKFDIVISSKGGKANKSKCHGLTIAEAVDWLSTDVVAGLLPGEPDRPTTLTAVTRRQQWQDLWTQADRFTQVGGYVEAIALREAALLLDDPFEARVQLIADYLHGEPIRQRRDHEDALKTMVRSPSGSGYRGTEQTQEFWKVRSASAFEYYRRCQQLIELLLANRQVNIVEGGLLWVRGLTLQRTAHDREWALRFHQERASYYWNNIPRLQRLDPTLRDGIPHPLVLSATQTIHKIWDDSPGRHSKVWSSVAENFLVSVTGPPKFTRREEFPADSGLRAYEKLLTEFHDPGCPIPFVVAASMPGRMGLMQVGYNSEGLLAHAELMKLTPDDLADHYHRLINTGEPWATFYGRAGLWGEAVRKKSSTPEEITRDYQSLMLQLDELRQATPQNSDLVTDIQLILSTVHFVNSNSVGALVARIHNQHRSSNPQRPVPQKVESVQVTFEEIPGTHAPYAAIHRCRDGIDAVWNNDRLWFMSAEGDLAPVFERPDLNVAGARDFLQEVQFDGELLWCSTAETGLRVFNLNGTLLGHLPPLPVLEGDGSSSASTSQSAGTSQLAATSEAVALPPFKANRYPRFRDGTHPHPPIPMVSSLRILPIGGRRCLVAATYGPLDRLWIALVTLDAHSAWQMRILHQATRVAKTGDDTQFQDTHIAATPAWFTRFEHPLPQPHPIAVMGRIVPLTTTVVPPLVIDLTTFEVSILEGNFSERGNSRLPVIAANGRLVRSTPHLLESITPVLSSDGGIEWQSQQFIASPLRNYSVSVEGMFVCGEDTAYVATWNSWGRLDTRNWTFHLGHPVPSGTRFEFQAMSSKHGLVAWNLNGPLHRVVMNQ